LGGIFRDFGVHLSLSGVVMSWLMPQQASNCISHPHGMYRKCFGILICYEQAYVSTLTLLCRCRLGVDFGDFGVDLSLYDVVMSWLRPQQASDWIPHPYWMYTKYFGTLICCVWVYEATLTVIHLCRWRVDFGVLGVDLSLCDVVMSWLRPQ
jgi:hypothetical protein